jgi:hypothetical protein
MGGKHMKTVIKPESIKIEIEGKASMQDWNIAIREEDKAIFINVPGFYVGLLCNRNVKVTIETID